MISVSKTLAYHECLRSFCPRAHLDLPRLQAAAIGAVDGALVAGLFAIGRAYAQSSNVAGGCEGHGPLDPRAAARR